jgi:hypothetical protein
MRSTTVSFATSSFGHFFAGSINITFYQEKAMPHANRSLCVNDSQPVESNPTALPAGRSASPPLRIAGPKKVAGPSGNQSVGSISDQATQQRANDELRESLKGGWQFAKTQGRIVTNHPPGLSSPDDGSPVYAP